MKDNLDGDTLIVRNKPYYLSNLDLEKLCKIVNQIDGEKYRVAKDKLEYKWKKGKTLFPSDEKDLRKIAFGLADLHILFQGINSDYCPIQFHTHFPNIDEKTIKLMKGYFNKSKYPCIEIIKCLSVAMENLKNIKLPSQIIHGDAHPYNCLIDGDAIKWIDFIDLHYDSRLIDIVWFMIFSICWDEEYKRIKKINLKDVCEFINAYNSRNELESVEFDKLPYVFGVLLVYSLFSVHSLWREMKKANYIENNIYILEENLRYIMEDLKWNFR